MAEDEEDEALSRSFDYGAAEGVEKNKGRDGRLTVRYGNK